MYDLYINKKNLTEMKLIDNFKLFIYGSYLIY